ncbi:hypothetical protein B0H13DRAFT_1936320 [Mycena leptocephala]|nr:hypothetical protein B0H13DRAFT_1936320 [Mycena leptocephala]
MSKLGADCPCVLTRFHHYGCNSRRHLGFLAQKSKPKLTKEQEQRKREAQREASARYRERNPLDSATPSIISKAGITSALELVNELHGGRVENLEVKIGAVTHLSLSFDFFWFCWFLFMRGDIQAMKKCAYYAVWEGSVRGAFTNSWLAREQTDGWTDSRQKSFKKWLDLLAWWQHMCLTLHQGTCPPFEAVNFSLDPDPTTHPSPAPCCRQDDDKDEDGEPAASPAKSGAAAASSSSSYQPAYVATGAPPSYNGGFPTAAPSPFTSSSHTTATKKEEDDGPSLANLSINVPRVTPTTRVNLTPTGHARAAALLQARASVVPSVVATPARAAADPTPIPSVLMTPGPAAPAPAVGPAPPAPRIILYGICGVTVFYNSHADALAAAGRLGMPDAKIMVSDNPDKLEAWMLGKPFRGEDT